MFYRERAVMMYRPLAFGVATLLAEIPYVVAQTTVFVPIVSGDIHLVTAQHHVLYLEGHKYVCAACAIHSVQNFTSTTGVDAHQN